MAEKKTPRLGHPPIAMVRVEKPAHIRKPGQFAWHVNSKQERVIYIAIPVLRNGATKWNGENFETIRWTINHKNHCGAQWGWDGDLDKPTLNPSLHAVGDWHGWVKAGYLKEA